MIENRAFLYADGFFTTFLVENGRVCALKYHFERLKNAVLLLDLACPNYVQSFDQFCEFLTKHVPKSQEIQRVRLMIWRKEGRVYSVPEKAESEFYFQITAYERSVLSNDIHLVSVSIPRISSLALPSSIKWLSGANSILAQQEAVKKGGNLALQLSSNGLISETPNACVFWVDGDTWFTPDLHCDVLPGTTRADFIDFCTEKKISLKEVQLSAQKFVNPQEMVVMNAVFGAREVSRFNQKRFEFSPNTKKTIQLFNEWRIQKAHQLYD